MKRIYLDESGNTGAKLLDNAQPVFTLASNNYTDDEAAELIALVKSQQASEAKFASLKKSPKGRARLLEFFKHRLLAPERTKTTAFHKQYMILTKVVDILIENIAHETGLDLYEGGLNIAMSNMHFYCMPTFCGSERFEKFLDAFVEMVREQTRETIEAFYSSVEVLMRNSINRDYIGSLYPIAASKMIINDILSGNNYLALDPAIPALFNHCTHWGEVIGDEFVVVHDTSKPIRAHIDVFNQLMSKELEPIELGYDRRKFKIPLRTSEIQFGDSKKYHQLQAADLVASATSFVANAIALGHEEEFSKSLRDCGVEQLMINVIWPSPEVTPDELGTNQPGGINAANHLAEMLRK